MRALLRLGQREPENRRSSRLSVKAERRFEDAADSAGCGLWDYDVRSGRLDWFGAHHRLVGRPPESFSGKIEAFLDALHADDRPRVWQPYKIHGATGRALCR